MVHVCLWPAGRRHASAIAVTTCVAVVASLIAAVGGDASSLTGPTPWNRTPSSLFHRLLPPNTAQGKQHVAEGLSLRQLIALADVFIPNEDAWEVFYDEESGHPYYFNKVCDVSPALCWVAPALLSCAPERQLAIRTTVFAAHSRRKHKARSGTARMVSLILMQSR